MRHNDAQATAAAASSQQIGTKCRACRCCIDEAEAPGSVSLSPGRIPEPRRGGPGMHSVFYIIGVIVVVLAILSLLGLT
jgi:hypothetical protein